jgi:hypothetical protein
MTSPGPCESVPGSVALRKALENEEKSAEVTLPGHGKNKMTIYIDHIVSI